MSKKKSNKTLYISIAVIIVVTLLFLLTVRIINKGNTNTYNDFIFQKSGMLWTTYAEKDGQPYQIPFYYHPSELEDIIVQPGAANMLLEASRERNQTKVFITLPPSLKSKAVVAAVEISRITGNRYQILNLETHGALTHPPEEGIALADTQSPIVTCANADNETIVIWLTLSQTNVVSARQGCIILEGTDEENLLRAADRFAYQILGIMQ